MKCRHCGFSCTSRGSDMSRKDFHSAIALAVEYEQTVTIGGGEPTLHPLFKEFMQHALWELASVTENYGCPAVSCITNGSNKDIALKMAKLAAMGILAARVSQDQYHDASMVDPAVFKAFEPRKDSISDCRGINGDGGYIQPVGRAKKWGYHPLITCVCDSVFITPKGDVWPCACKAKGTQLGHVSKNPQVVYEHFEGYCAKSDGYKENVLPVLKENFQPA